MVPRGHRGDENETKNLVAGGGGHGPSGWRFGTVGPPVSIKTKTWCSGQNCRPLGSRSRGDRRIQGPGRPKLRGDFACRQEQRHIFGRTYSAWTSVAPGRTSGRIEAGPFMSAGGDDQ